MTIGIAVDTAKLNGSDSTVPPTCVQVFVYLYLNVPVFKCVGVSVRVVISVSVHVCTDVPVGARVQAVGV